MPVSRTGESTPRSDRRGRVRLIAAACWLAAFSGWFYHFGLPNNPPISRPDFWWIVPDRLIDLADPPSAQDGSAWAHLPQRFDVFLLAGLIVAAAWGLGNLVLAAVRPPLDERCAERTVFAFGCGISLLTLLTLGCGLAGWLSRAVLGSLVVLGIIGGIAVRARPWRRSVATILARPAHARTLSAVCLVAVAPFVVAMLLGATLPPSDFDAKAYHLVGPKEWFLDGRIAFLPHNVYTSFPFLTEMLTLAGMVLRDDWYRGALVGQAVLASFAPFTAVALYAAGRRWFSPAAGWLAVLVYLTTPWTYRISIIAYAEGGLSFFLFAALLATAVALQRQSSGESPAYGQRQGQGQGRMLLLAGLLAGSAMACKYTGAVQSVIPLGLAAVVGACRRVHAPRTDFQSVPDPRHAPERGQVLPSRRTDFQSVPHACPAWLRLPLFFAAGVALAIGPWLLKNAIQTGNPVYPLAYSVFGGRDWDAELDERFRAGHSSRPDQYTPAHLVANLVDVAARNDWHSGLLFALAPLAFLAKAHRRFAGWLWLYVAYLFLAWWLLTHRIDRFWVPMIPVVSLLAGAGAAWCGRRAWKLACGTTIAAGVLFNLAFVSTALAGNNAWLGDLDRLRSQSEEFAPSIAVLNGLYDAGRLPAGSKTLLVGDAQVFDARFPHVYNTVFDRSLFKQWFGERDPADPAAPDGWRLADAAGIRRRLAAAGITHVAVNWQELLRYRTTYGYTGFVAPSRFAALQEQGLLDPPVALLVSRARVDELPPDVQQQLDAWATELKIDTPDGVHYVTAQLFALAAADGPAEESPHRRAAGTRPLDRVP